MWYFAWILGVLLACSFGIINVLWLEAQESLDQHTSVLDPLTKLPNRVEFLTRLEHTITELSSNQGRFSLLMISFDEFEWVSKQLGEKELDTMLFKFSDIIKHEIRTDIDIAARYDAKTFAVILPGAKQAIAEVTAQHICQACIKQLTAAQDKSIVSIGISEYQNQPGTNQQKIKSLLLTTDQRLKAAQKITNNQYVSS